MLQIRFLLFRGTPGIFMILIWLLGRLFSCCIILWIGILMTFHGSHGLLLRRLFLSLFFRGLFFRFFFRGLLLRIGSIWLCFGSRLLLCRLDFLFLRGRFWDFLLIRNGILRSDLLIFFLICKRQLLLHTGLLLHTINDIGIII